MNNKLKKIITIAIISSCSLSFSSFAQEGGLAFGVIKRKENYTNKQMYPFLHQWNDVKTEQLLSKIEQYSLKHEVDGPLRSKENQNYKSWHVRQIIHAASSCLDKAIYEQPGFPSSPFTDDYSARIKKIHKFMNLADEKFELPNERVFNQFCGTILESDFESGYCTPPENKTISVDLRNDFAIFNGMNITTNTKELPKSIPLKCTLGTKSPEMTATFEAPVSYTIIKPFRPENVATSQGNKQMNVGQIRLVFKDAINSNKKLIYWDSPIYQHVVPARTATPAPLQLGTQ